MPGIYDFQVQTANVEHKSLYEYRGQVLLIVNSAVYARPHVIDEQTMAWLRVTEVRPLI